MAVVVGLLVQVYLARALGPDLFGVVAFLTAVAALFAALAQMNLPLLVAREVARDAARAGSLLGRGVVTTAGLSVAATACIVAYVAVFDGRLALLVAAGLAGIALGARSVVLMSEAIFQGLRRMRALATSALVGRVALLVATVVAVEAGGGVSGVFGASAIAGLMAFAVLLVAFRREVGPASWSVTVRDARALVWEGRHFGFNQLFSAIYIASDLLVLQAFRGETDLGLYRAASLLVIQLPIVAVVLSRAVYPRLARLAGDPRAAGAELSFEIRLLLVLSVPMAIGGLCVAEPLLVFLVGDAYVAATPAMLWLLLIVPPRFVSNAVGNALTALDRQEARTRGVGVAALVNLSANLVVIPRFGPVGAAATTFFTEIVLLVWLALALRGGVRGVAVAGPLLRACVPALPMAAVVLALPSWHVAARVALGGVVYVVLARATRAWTPADVATLRAL